MKMKKVLIISYSFPPDNAPAAQRPYFMAKYLSKLGYDVCVLTTSNSDSSLGKSKWADTSNMNVYKADSLEVPFLKNRVTNNTVSKKVSKPSKFKIFLNKIIRKTIEEVMIPDKALVWYKNAYKQAKVICTEKKIDYVFSTSPSMVNHLVARKLKKQTKIKWIADIRDYYYLDTRQNKYIFRGFFDKRIETNVLKESDATVFISASMKKEYNARYPFLSSKSYVIHNGLDKEEFEKIKAQPKNKDKMTVFYAGSFYAGVRSPLPLLAALDNLIFKGELDKEKVEVKIAGNLDDISLSKMQKYTSFDCVNYIGRIAREEVLNEYAKAHLLWLIVGETKAHYTGFPVKGYEYIGSRTPILVFTPKNSEPERIINELNCGKRLSNDMTDEEISKNSLVIKDFYNMFLEGTLNQPIHLDNNILKKYTRQFQAEQLADLF